MCKKLRITNFKSCFMRDEINSLKSSKDDECFVINKDDSSSSGTHWTAKNVSDGTTFYFDSYGLEPTLEINKYCNEPRFSNTFEIQKPNEVFCGHLCLYFLYRMRNCKKDFFTVLDELYEIYKKHINIMQVVDYSKKYELPKQCGHHAEIFPQKYILRHSWSHWVWQNKSDGEFATTRTKNKL